MALVTVTLLLAWGALSFGAVYDWGAVPLAAGVTVLAALHWRPRERPGAVGLSAAVLMLALGLQLLPLPAAFLEAVSPAGAEFLRHYDLAFATGVTTSHALSVAPSLTARTVAYLLLWTVWAATVASMASHGLSLRRLARNIAIVAAVIGVLGLAQQATFNGKLLWFWTPEYRVTNSFGPFVNRNHFAGWMVLALGITLGLVPGYGSRSAPDRRTPWRDRLLWLGTPAASPVLLAAAAVVAITCALVWTMSRSGMLGAAAAVSVFTIVAVCRARGGARLLIAGTSLALAAGIIGWRGADTLVAWYEKTDSLQWRLQLWADTMPVLRDFWLTGSGLNTYGQLMLIRPRTDLTSDPVQAHNDYLQLAVEGGVLVTIPALLLIGVAAYRTWRAFRTPQDPMTWWVRLGAVAGISGMAVQEISEFSLQIPGIALLFATCVGLAVHEPSRRVRRLAEGPIPANPIDRVMPFSRRAA